LIAIEDVHHQLSTASWYNATILPDKCNRDNALFLSSGINRQNSLVLPALHIKSAYTGTLCAYGISAYKVGSTFSSLCCVQEAKMDGWHYLPSILLFGIVSRVIKGLMNVRALQQAKSIKGEILHMN
jgi:hypothetical protein